MSGYICGVAAQIQREEPSALYVHCLAHCTNLCLQTVWRAILPSTEISDGFKSINTVFTTAIYIYSSQCSPKCHLVLQALNHSAQPDVRTSAIQSVLTNYRVLCDVLVEISRGGKHECAAKAGGFLNQLENFYIYFEFKHSHLLFSAIEQVSLTLQGVDTTIQEAV